MITFSCVFVILEMGPIHPLLPTSPPYKIQMSQFTEVSPLNVTFEYEFC